ncbi:hypothetical protein QBC38DRAFT_86381 [Podospora fimiseda]|uniref:Uncharacterized protein n=1 Tax=Podospora fimiseda TaxID=252190 RepID=A0AAN6YSU7_9PEZI|nr:hypothetical protein QBC38DRAFT_86381 [Podospora fimiseda]
MVELLLIKPHHFSRQWCVTSLIFPSLILHILVRAAEPLLDNHVSSMRIFRQKTCLAFWSCMFVLAKETCMRRFGPTCLGQVDLASMHARWCFVTHCVAIEFFSAPVLSPLPSSNSDSFKCAHLFSKDTQPV